MSKDNFIGRTFATLSRGLRRSPGAAITVAGLALAVATTAASFPAALILGGLLLAGAMAVRRIVNELSETRPALKRVRARTDDIVDRKQR